MHAGSAEGKTRGVVRTARNIVVEQQCHSGLQSEDDVTVTCPHHSPLSVHFKHIITIFFEKFYFFLTGFDLLAIITATIIYVSKENLCRISKRQKKVTRSMG